MYLSLNVGGEAFYIRVASLRTVPHTLLTDIIDASLPPDLIFGGRALRAPDVHGKEKEKFPENAEAERKDAERDPLSLSTDGDPVSDSHPYERAKYMYFSCPYLFRLFPSSFTLASSATSSTTNTATHAAVSPSKKTSTATTAATAAAAPPDSNLFLPATTLTSPRHKPVTHLFCSHDTTTRLEGFTNKSFLVDECGADATHHPASPSHYGPPSNTLGEDDTHKPHHLHQTHAEEVSRHSHHPGLDHRAEHAGVIVALPPQETLMSSAVHLPHAKTADIYIDRNPLLFPYILDLYRYGQLHLPPNVCSLTIRMELDFWKIPEELIGECCWREFQSGLDRMTVVSAISATLTDRYDDPEVREQLTKAGRFWLTMERPQYSTRAKVWCVVYYVFILLSIVTFMLLTLRDFLEVKPEFEDILNDYTADNDTLHVVHYGTFHKAVDWLEGTEICLDIFFTVEFAARLFTCPNKKEFVRNKHNIIDISILTTAWTRAIYDRIITWDSENYTEARSFAMVVLNCMLGLRVLRMLHMAKIFRTLKVMYLSILASMQELALLVVVMGAGVLLFGSALYIAEGFSTPDDQPLQFESIPDAMWWAIITMTTVGYGDFYPVHAAGYIVGAICAVSGLLLVAMPIAIVASNFSTFYDNMSSRDQSLRRRSMLGKLIGIAMAPRGGSRGGSGGGGGGGAGETTQVHLTGSEAIKETNTKPRESSPRKKGHDISNGGKDETESADVPEAVARTVFRSQGRLTGNGHIKSGTKDEPHHSGGKGHSSNSRKDRHSDRPRSSSSPRKTNARVHRDSGGIGETEKDGRITDVAGDHKKHHRPMSGGRENGYISHVDGSPMVADYVGVRTDGVGKDKILAGAGEPKTSHSSKHSVRVAGLNTTNLGHTNVSTKRSHRSKLKTDASTDLQLGPVG